MRTLNEVKNELADLYHAKMTKASAGEAMYARPDFMVGFDAAIEHLSKSEGGREFYLNFGTTHGVDVRTKEQFENSKYDKDYQDVAVHVIEHSAYLALKLKLDKAVEALQHYESSHYDSEGHPCMNDKTAEQTLKEIGAE